MAKRIKRKKRTSRGSSLSGTSASRTLPLKDSILPGLFTLVTGVAAGGMGAGLGPLSVPLALASVIYGVKRNDANSKYFLAAGVGLLAGTAVKKATESGAMGIEDEEMDGFDIKQMALNAKERTKAYFENLATKLYLPVGKSQEPSETNGLNGEDEVSYFINPYTRQDDKLSELDRIQAQITEMNTPVSGTVGMLDAAERNF